MICYEFKGGTGTASRVVVEAEGHTQWACWFKRTMVFATGSRSSACRWDPGCAKIGCFGAERGSIIVIVGTDAPMLPHQLRRVAKRAAIGIGRNGTPGGNNSGDIFLAFSVANDVPIARCVARRNRCRSSPTTASMRSTWRPSKPSKRLLSTRSSRPKAWPQSKLSAGSAEQSIIARCRWLSL